jgi:hypothetical protein
MRAIAHKAVHESNKDAEQHQSQGSRVRREYHAEYGCANRGANNLPLAFVPFRDGAPEQGPIGPSLVNVDLSLIKNIRLSRISEAFNLPLRVEAFNIFNHTNFQAPVNNNSFGGQLGFNQVSPGTGGLINSTATPSRQLQLGAKVVF